MKIDLNEYKDLHPAMRQYITSRAIIAGIVSVVLTIILSVIFGFGVGVIPLLLGLGYELYIVGLVVYFLNGKGDMYEGIVIKGTDPNFKRTKFRDGARLLTGKSVSQTIRLKTLADGQIIEVKLKGYGEFEEGNKVTLFTPSNAAYRKANDFYTVSSYNKIIID